MFHSSGVRRLAPTALLLTLCLLIPACGKNKVTKSNYDKVTTGMTRDEVEAILGQGTKEGDASNVAAQFGVNLESAPGVGRATETYVWEKGNKSIRVFFVNDKVLVKKESGF